MSVTRTSGRQRARQPLRRAAGGTEPARRAHLERHREQVADELARLRANLREWPASGIDEYDPSAHEYAKNLALAEHFEERLAEIDGALGAAQCGTYGLCQGCGRPIGQERLRVLPDTRWCVRCKIQMESRARYTTAMS